MKKILTFMWLAATALQGMAADYTDRLTVDVNGNVAEQQATISVDQTANGDYTLTLKNFKLEMGRQTLNVGNIELKDVKGTTAGAVTTLRTSQTINITEGTEAGVPLWIGPSLGPVPVNMVAELRAPKAYAVIDIDMQATLGQTIRVVFGNGGYHIENGGFEDFHTATITDGSGENTAKSDEPNHWHSFMSTSGDPSLRWLAGYNPHTFISDVVRPGSTGKHSVKITSTKIFIFVANGTITTGRLNTGSMTASNKANHSWLDLSSTDKDAHGDPFYLALNGRPDSLTVWVKFKQGTPQPKAPYATVNAVLTDGTRYQDPEDKAYTNIVAKATDNKIASKDFAWQRLSIPFDYDTYAANGVEPKALLITISTNAQPGKGSTDELYVDDIALVYNARLSALSVKGKPVEGFDAATLTYNLTADGPLSATDIVAKADGRGATVDTQVEPVEGGVKALVTVTSNDLLTATRYTLNITGATTGINTATTTGNQSSSAVEFYNLQGQRVSSMHPGRVYIRKSGGKSVKVVKESY